MTDLVKPVAALRFAQAGLVTMEIEPEVALKEARKWEGGTPAEARVSEAYRAVAEGRQLIDLEKSLQSAGADSTRRPKLAICQAGMRRVKLETWYSSGRVRFYGRFGWSYETEMANVKGFSDDKGAKAEANAPTMPPAIRRIANDDDLLLWEAQWRKNVIKRQIVIDPALLERVTGNLYVVKAAWELTELEAAALRG